MTVHPENLRYILGLKLKQLRLKKGLTLKQLAERTNLSISFLSEIEKGKKYPKPEKIMHLAAALDVPFDELVSLKVDQELDPVTSILDSPFLREFPFELFGIAPRDVVHLVTDQPSKAGAFIRTFLEIAETYDMRVEHFLFSALRSYQKMHLNYFEDLEQTAVRFRAERAWSPEPPLDPEPLRRVLTEDYGYILDEESLERYPELRGFRSIWVEGERPRLIINPNLLPSQKAFILGREIGYQYLDLKERATTSSWLKVESFEQVLNNYKASYFSGALLIERELLGAALRNFFNNTAWHGEQFLDLMRRFHATPEMFLYRLSQLIPKLFGLTEIYYLRFNNQVGRDIYRLTKELNMSRVRVPHGVGLNEHYCRRWLSISLLKELAARQQGGEDGSPMIAAQRSRFLESDAEFFTITLARPLALTEGTNSSISLGFLMNEAFKERVRFWNDPAVPTMDVNETCERCGLSEAECQDRVAPPEIYRQQQTHKVREEGLARLMDDLRNQEG